MIDTYRLTNNGRYPAPDKWCHVLIISGYVNPAGLRCPTAAKGQYHYAMNPACEPNSPPDTVLLFETSDGWNQYGGPEILTTENHGGKGCNILFNDGTVKFVPPQELAMLKWKVEQAKR
ncbi:MAG TPA: hypothetical protein VMX13_15270 [Sedimentisphaerales bacterium]|nr:hypothetical protein [Sedimentisphaerales bacterium]